MWVIIVDWKRKQHVMLTDVSLILDDSKGFLSQSGGLIFLLLCFGRIVVFSRGLNGCDMKR